MIKLIHYIKSIIAILLYRILELIDGEKSKLKYINYKIAEKIKIYLLKNWIE